MCVRVFVCVCVCAYCVYLPFTHFPFWRCANRKDAMFTDHMLPMHMCTHFSKLAVCFPSRLSMTVVVQTTMFIVSVLKRKRPALCSHRNRHRAKAATIDSRPSSVSLQPLAAMFSQPNITERKRGGGGTRDGYRV